jgi:hypothetical protein
MLQTRKSKTEIYKNPACMYVQLKKQNCLGAHFETPILRLAIVWFDWQKHLNFQLGA